VRETAIIDGPEKFDIMIALFDTQEWAKNRNEVVFKTEVGEFICKVTEVRADGGVQNVRRRKKPNQYWTIKGLTRRKNEGA
jgi:hypothetical protein